MWSAFWQTPAKEQYDSLRHSTSSSWDQIGRGMLLVMRLANDLHFLSARLSIELLTVCCREKPTFTRLRF